MGARFGFMGKLSSISQKTEPLVPKSDWRTRHCTPAKYPEHRTMPAATRLLAIVRAYWGERAVPKGEMKTSQKTEPLP
jgi:hypothetical protein